MKRTVVLALLTACLGVSEEKRVTWTGWFSDAKCALSRAAGGTFSETNPDCAKRCIEKGEAPVFISEQAQAVFNIQGYDSVIPDLGYRIELEGMLDQTSKNLRVISVKRLEFQGPACSRTKKK